MVMPPYQIKETTPPTVMLVTMDEVKDHLGIGDDDVSNDPKLAGMIRAAIRVCERHTRRTFMSTTYTLYMDKYPGRKNGWWDGVRQGADAEIVDLKEAIILPRPPLQSVTSITSYLEDGTTSVVSSANYIVDTYSEPGRVSPTATQAWPSVALRQINGVEVIWVAGYGDDMVDTPQEIRQAVMTVVGDMFENPIGAQAKLEKVGNSSVARFDPADLPVPARNLLSSFKIWNL